MRQSLFLYGTLVLLLPLVLWPSGADAGEITGEVTIYGPVSKKVQMISPYARQRYAKSPVSTSEGGDASNIIVYLEDPPA